LRKFFQTAGAGETISAASIGLAPSLDDLSPADVQAKTLVIPGSLTMPGLARLKILAPSCARLLLLNPTFFPQELGLGPQLSAKIVVFFGEFSQSAGLEWADAAKQSVHTVEGAGDYLPHWPELGRGHRGQSTYLDSVSRRAGDAALRLAGIPVARAKRRQLQPDSTPTQGPSVKIC
jgi:hypothetical protein